ncbi:MAG: pyridoxal phosphate-dependent aminotransferase [Leptolyngbyaceae cyanobacterium]
MQMRATRMDGVQLPVIPLVGELIHQHPGTISLGQGVVYYGPPQEAIAQLSKALEDPDNHKYQSVAGIPPLRQAIAEKLVAENHIPMQQRQVVVTAGSNMGFLNAVLAITQPGDEVILQVPYYFNHEMAIQIAGCHPVLVPTDQVYQLQLEAIQRAITNRTRAVVTISPNNPTGVVYPSASLQAVNELCRTRGLYHITDEAYEYFTYDGVNPFAAASIPGSEPYTISLFSLSKAYGFASWRIGYMVIPEHLMTPIMKIQDTNLICPPVPCQYGALAALQAGRSYCQQRLSTIAANRQLMMQELSRISDLCVVPPAQGAFYFLLRLHTTRNAMDLVQALIHDHQVAVLPGTTFGLTAGCYLRVSYGALQTETAIAGASRLVAGLTRLLEKE